MFKYLRIQNFKGWKDTKTIQMAPITLFFGTNSSGKSSIGHFLMMLKQTVELPDRKAVFYPGNTKSAVELGSYHDFVFQHDPENKIDFEYQWTLEKTLNVRDSDSKKSYSGNTLSFASTVGLTNGDQHPLAVEKLRYELQNEGKDIFTINMYRSESGSKYKVEATGYELKKQRGRAWPLNTPYRFYGFPDEVVAYHQNADFVQDLNLYHERLFRSLFYLGPLRTKAVRLYSWTGIEPESVGYAGENSIAAILSAHDRKLNLGYKRLYKGFQEIIALQLKAMNLIEEFQVERISEHRQEYEVKLRTKGSRDWVTLSDVGFGISQVLPVLVQCFYAPPGSTIIIEQPEIHLHPSAQAALADVMIDVIKSRENNSDRNIQLIIETHSEHFLRRLQRRVAEDILPQESIAAYFADVSKAPAQLDPLQLDLYGNIKNWPENFFGDEMEDVMAQAKAAMQKRKRQSTDG